MFIKLALSVAPAVVQTRCALQIQSGLTKEPLGADYSEPPASPTPALAHSAYTGTYTNTFFGDTQIIEKGDELGIVEGPHRLTFPMKHYDRDIFIYKTEGENAVGASGVIFTIGPEGKAMTMVVENLN